MSLSPVAILAGGLGTRLGALGETTPKALVPVAGRPFALWQLELLRAHGARRVVMCVGHLGRHALDRLRGALRADALDLPGDDLSEIYRALAERGELAGYEATERFYEIGTPGSLADTSAFLSASSGMRRA